MKNVVPTTCLVLLAACGGQPTPAPTPTPTVKVTVQPMQRGTAPEWLTAYGSATPALNGSQTISVPQPGQVTSLSVKPGIAVHQGQTLAVFTTDPTTVSGYKQAITTLTAARKQQATTSQLLTQQLATRDQLVQADKAVADAQAAVAALQQQGAGQPVRTLSAPFNGVVTTVAVAQGDRTAGGAPLLTVARSSGIVATVGLDPAERNRVHVGEAARIARLNGGASIAGHVIRVDSVLNPRTRLIDVDLAFPTGALLPNEALRGEIAVGQVAGWIVPHKAVVTANGPTRLFQVVAGKARAVPVKLMLAGDPVDVVDGSLNANFPLIVDGAYQVDNGVAVQRVGR